MLQHGWPLIPERPDAAVDDVISIKGADRHALHPRDAELSSQFLEDTLQLQKEIFAEMNAVHLIDGGQHAANTEQSSDECVTASLRKDDRGGVKQNHRACRRGHSGSRVA